MTKKRSFIWNAPKHETLMHSIMGMYESDPEEFKIISEAAEALLKKYTNCDFLDEEAKEALHGLRAGWHSDTKNESIIVDGSLDSSDFHLNAPYSWQKKENREEKSKRKKMAKAMTRIKFKSCSSLYIRRCELSQLWENLPRSVHYFDCSGNSLKSLKNGPQKVKSYICSSNKLKSLKHIAKEITQEIDCSNNEITTLTDFNISTPIEVLKCHTNKLKSLEGCPPVNEKLNVSYNKLVSMKGAPMNLTLRDIDLRGNVVSDKSLKLAFNAMKAAKGDYSAGLLKIWNKIPMEDQMHMYLDLPNVTSEDVRKYEAYRNYLSIKDVL